MALPQLPRRKHQPEPRCLAARLGEKLLGRRDAATASSSIGSSADREGDGCTAGRSLGSWELGAEEVQAESLLDASCKPSSTACQRDFCWPPNRMTLRNLTAGELKIGGFQFCCKWRWMMNTHWCRQGERSAQRRHGAVSQLLDEADICSEQKATNFMGCSAQQRLLREQRYYT